MNSPQAMGSVNEVMTTMNIISWFQESLRREEMWWTV